MFYSHEILTSRKYGVATIWLVATLGSKTSLRKITRKAILDVNIPKACDVVLDPGAPMALRLQSNLLYGISCVYSQQCMYILVDAQAAHSNMKALLKVVRTSDLDPHAGKSKPDQLVLHDDPAFMPDNLYPVIDMDMNYSMLESSQATLDTSIALSDAHHTSSQSSQGDLAIPQLEMPSAGSSGFDFGSFEFPGPVPGSPSHRFAIDNPDDVGFTMQPEFIFDEDGNFIDLSAPIEPLQPQSGITPGAQSEYQVVGQVAQQAAPASDEPLDQQMDIDFQFLQDDQQELPPAEPFPDGEARRTSENQSREEGSEHAEGPQTRKLKRKRGPRQISRDYSIAIRNSELQRWNDEYPAMMRQARKEKARNKVAYQAKKNAEFFVIDRGIGDCGISIGSSGLAHPFADLFSGPNFFRAVTGRSSSEAADEKPNLKRSRSASSEATSDSAARRVRARLEEDAEAGRGEALEGLEDDGMGLPFGADQSIEMARQAQTLLEEHSSQMPWNISSRGASRAPSHVGSAQRSQPGSAVSVRAPGSVPPSATSFDRRASRLPMASPSPLVGRGSLPLPTIAGGPSSSNGGVGDTGLLLGLPSGGVTGDSDDNEKELQRFELFGPAAAVSTQTQAQSQWVRDVLDQESGNFLGFVRTAIEDKAREERGVGMEIEGEGEEQAAVAGVEGKEVSFAELLPPEKHSSIVAAQAFLHVLSLANRGVLSTRQETINEAGEEVWWGALWLGVGVLPVPSQVGAQS